METFAGLGCLEVDGELVVSAGDILDLAPLTNVTSVQGGMSIASSSIESLHGLGGLTSLGSNEAGRSLAVQAPRLGSLAPLAALRGALPGGLAISRCAALESLAGLEGITALGSARLGVSLSLFDNERLGSISALAGALRGALSGSLEIMNCPALEALAGLEGLTSLRGGLVVKNNPRLGSLAALAALRGNLSHVFVKRCPVLQSLTGLEGLSGLTSGLVLRENLRLGTLAALAGLRQVWALEVVDCPALESLSGLEDLTSIKGSLRLSRNARMASVATLASLRTSPALVSVQDCGALTSLQGIVALAEGTPELEVLFGAPPQYLCFSAAERGRLVRAGHARVPSAKWTWREDNADMVLRACRTCGDAGCGRFEDGHPIECDYHTGRCRCPLGTVGPNCSAPAPEVSTTQALPAVCVEPASGDAACEVKLDLLRHWPEASTVQEASGEALTPQITGGNATSDGSEADFSVDGSNISWENATHGQMRVTLRINHDHRFEGVELVTMRVGYRRQLHPDMVLSGTLVSPPTGTGRVTFPWCLASGACLRYAPGSFVAYIGESPTGMVAFQERSYEVTEDRDALVELVRTGGSSSDISVYVIASPSGTASPDVDFLFRSALVTWRDGDLSPKAIAVPLANDLDFEPPETIELEIVGVSATGDCSLSQVVLPAEQSVGTPRECTITIVDDGDGGLLRFADTGVAVDERTPDGASPCIAWAERTGAFSGNASAAVVLGPCSGRQQADPVVDFSFASGTVSWGSGDGSLRCAVHLGAQPNGSGALLTVHADVLAEPDEAVCLSLRASSASAAALDPAASLLVIRLRDLGACKGTSVQLPAEGAQVPRACACGPGSGAQRAGDAASCERCAPGRYQPGITLQACLECPGEANLGLVSLISSSEEGSLTCGFHAKYCLWSASILILGFLAALILFRSLRRQVRIVDVSAHDGRLVITTFGAHGLWRWSMADVVLADTGNFRLQELSAHLRVRWLDWERLELLDAAGKPIAESLDTSKGTMVFWFPQDLTRTGHGLRTLLQAALLWGVACATEAAAGLRASTWFVAAGLGILLAGGAAAAERWYRRATRTPLERRLRDFRRRLAFRNPRPCGCERGPGRAVRAAHLEELLGFFSDFIHSRNAYYLDACITRPLTERSQLSVAELLGPVELDFFVSHFWGTPFDHFVETVRNHAMISSGNSSSGNSWGRLGYWICFLSNNQWRLKEEVGNGSWQESSFYRALRSSSCQATCMILDADAKPLARSWCLFEVLQTYRLEHDRSDFQGLLYCTSRGVIGRSKDGYYDVAIALAKKLSSIHMQDATASNKGDQDMIENLVLQEGGFEAMNNFVRSNMRRTLENARDNFQLTMAELDTSLESAPAELAALKGELTRL